MTTQADLLHRRCRTAFGHQRAAAARDHVDLDYALADLVEMARATQTCAYCSRPLGHDFTFDHVIPVAWTSTAHRLGNIVCCCPACNVMKGQTDGAFFRRLLALLGGDTDPRAATDVQRRLTSGGKVYAGKRTAATPTPATLGAAIALARAELAVTKAKLDAQT
jgi:hypothetical protein